MRHHLDAFATASQGRERRPKQTEGESLNERLVMARTCDWRPASSLSQRERAEVTPHLPQNMVRAHAAEAFYWTVVW